jgi:hypothetical protein
MNLSSKELLLIITTIVITFLVSTVLVIFVSLSASIFGALFVVFCAFAYRFPRKSLWLFLIYLPLTGTITYSVGSVYNAVGGRVVFSTLYAIFHLVKDVFYFPALIAILLSSYWLKQFSKISKVIFIGGFVLLGTCLLTLFLVNLPQQLSGAVTGKPFLMGIMGLKILIGYVPFLICGYYLIRDRKDLNFFLRLHIIIIAISCILCLIQYLFLTTGICPGSVDLPHPASTRASLQARCFVGGSLLYNPVKKLISLPGTFNAPWQWAWFLIFGSFLSMASYFYEADRLWRIISAVTISLVLIAAIISGQTTATLLVPIILLVLIFATEANQKRFSYKLLIIILLLFLIANNFGIFGSALDSIIARWQYSPPQDFIIDQFKWINESGLKTLGYGLGKAASAARKLGKITLIETFYPRLLYEIGWLGTLVFLGFVTLISFYTFKAHRSLKSLSLWRLSFCWWLFIVLISYNTFYYPLIIEPVAIYYWLIAGILLKLPEIKEKVRE